jgi:hypothetical protein
MLMGVILTEEWDSFKWFLTQYVFFSVKSMYAYYMNGHTRFLLKIHMKSKGSIENKDFMPFLVSESGTY